MSFYRLHQGLKMILEHLTLQEKLKTLILLIKKITIEKDLLITDACNNSLMLNLLLSLPKTSGAI